MTDFNMPPGCTVHQMEERTGVLASNLEEAFLERLAKEMGEEVTKALESDVVQEAVLKAFSMGTEHGYQQHRSSEAEYWALAPKEELLEHLKKLRPDICWEATK